MEAGMMNYFKMVVFFGLTVVESFMNFVCSLFAYYPAFDFSTRFLVFNEIFRVRREILGRNDSRGDLNKKADGMVSLAKNLDSGQNIND